MTDRTTKEYTMRRVRVSAAAGAVAFLVLSACSGASQQAGSPGGEGYVDGGTFTIAVPDDLGAFDPYQNQTVWRQTSLAYDSLVNLRSDGGFVSGLAEKWTADARTARFTLRPDITCSDGTRLTASHVAAAVNHVGDPKNASFRYGLNTPTVPFTAQGDDGTRTVTVTTTSPFGLLLHAVGQLPIVCPRGLKDPGALKAGSDGTGPFVLTDVKLGQSYTFRRRDGYSWGPDGATNAAPGVPATVILRVIENESVAANLLASGEVNFAMVSGEDKERLLKQGVESIDRPGRGPLLYFNHSAGRPTADVRVRKALAQAMKLDDLTNVSTGGRGSASTGLVSMEPKPCQDDTVGGHTPSHDVGAAEALLDEAGWTRGPNGIRTKNGAPLSVRLLYNPTASTFEKPTVELIMQQLKAVGAQVVPAAAGTSAMLTQVLYETRDFELFLGGGALSLPSQWVPYFAGPLPPDGVNFADVHNAEYAREVSLAQRVSPPEACAAWSRAEQALFRAVDVLPVATRYETYFLQNARADVVGAALPVPTSLRLTR